MSPLSNVPGPEYRWDIVTTSDTVAAACIDWNRLATKVNLAATETQLTWRMAGIMIGLLASQGAPMVGLTVGLLQPLLS